MDILLNLFCNVNSIFFTKLSVASVHLHYMLALQLRACCRFIDAFLDLGESTVMAAHFVDDPLDLVGPLAS